MSYVYPKIHAFPPFFTRQQHAETWRKQRGLWLDLIIEHSRHARVMELDLGSAACAPPFHNPAIDRTQSVPVSSHAHLPH